MWSLSGIVNNDMLYCVNNFYTISSYIYENIHYTNNYSYKDRGGLAKWDTPPHTYYLLTYLHPSQAIGTEMHAYTVGFVPAIEHRYISIK